MNRRTAVASLLGAALGQLPAFGAAQRHRVVYVARSVGQTTRSWYAEHGLVDGRDFDLVVEPPVDPQEHEPWARRILQARPAVVVLFGWNMVFLFHRLTREVPLVFVNFGGDPVRLGLVESLRRPGGNMTGTCQMLMSMTPKFFEILREIKPGGRRGGVLIKESTLRSEHMAQGHEENARAAAMLRMEISAIVVPDDPALPAVQAAIERAGVDYLFVTEDLYSRPVMPQLIAYLERARLPALYLHREQVEKGGLVAVSPDRVEGLKRGVEIVARILRGERPASIPVQQSVRHHLAVNRRTARAMGLQLSASLLTRADEVVD